MVDVARIIAHKTDPRVQAIRCNSCHRLRAYPVQRGTKYGKGRHCHCGGVSFHPTFPHPDEEQLALKLYAQEIEKSNLYGIISREVVSDWRAEHGSDDDKPQTKRLILAE
jgi:hypothetical protein